MPGANLDRLMPWLLRLLWVAVLVAASPAIDQATADNGDAIGNVAVYGGSALWVTGVIAMAIPAVTSLTLVRIVVPVVAPAAAVAALAGAEAADAAAFAVTSCLAVLVAFSAELGGVFVQSSAYGAEDRHLLRPPVAYAVAATVTWLTWAALVIVAPLALADRRWILGSLAAVGVVGGLVLGWPRWHRLSQRWFVVVPVGVVIHDQLVLAETLMLRRQEVAGIRLAPAGTEAADFTGPAAGHAVEIDTTESVTAIYAATPKQPHGTAIHLRSCLIAPSRPGRALRAAAARRLPVG